MKDISSGLDRDPPYHIFGVPMYLVTYSCEPPNRRISKHNPTCKSAWHICTSKNGYRGPSAEIQQVRIMTLHQRQDIRK